MVFIIPSINWAADSLIERTRNFQRVLSKISPRLIGFDADAAELIQAAHRQIGIRVAKRELDAKVLDCFQALSVWRLASTPDLGGYVHSKSAGADLGWIAALLELPSNSRTDRPKRRTLRDDAAKEVAVFVRQLLDEKKSHEEVCQILDRSRRLRPAGVRWKGLTYCDAWKSNQRAVTAWIRRQRSS